MQCVAVALGCGDTDSRFALAKQLLRKGFAGWKVVQPGFSGEFLYPVQIRGGVERAVLAEPGRLKALVIPRSCGELETVMVLPGYLRAPVRKGQKLGSAAFTRAIPCSMKPTWWRQMPSGNGTSGMRWNK